jgi:hypothetical protein
MPSRPVIAGSNGRADNSTIDGSPVESPNFIHCHAQFACGPPKKITSEQLSIVFYGDPFMHDD